MEIRKEDVIFKEIENTFYPVIAFFNYKADKDDISEILNEMKDVTIPEDVSVELVLTVFGKKDVKLEGNIVDVNGEKHYFDIYEVGGSELTDLIPEFDKIELEKLPRTA